MDAILKSWERQGRQRRVAQHYVSRFYLRGFADKHRRVDVLDRTTGRIETMPIKRAAAKDHFYTVETEAGEEDFTVEAMLGWFEDRAAPALRKILGNKALSDQEREDFLVYLSFQIVRGPDHRAVHQQLTDFWAKLQASSWPKASEGMRQLLREALGSDPTDEEVNGMLDSAAHPEKWEVEPHQNESIKIMLDTAHELYPAVASRGWNVLEFQEPLLVTSDRPVFHWSNPEPSDELFGKGFANADEVRFALDAHRALILTLEGPEVSGELGPEWAWELNKTVAAWCHDAVFARPGNPHLPELAKGLSRRRPGIEIVNGGRRVSQEL